jgi:hypothetical protein
MHPRVDVPDGTLAIRSCQKEEHEGADSELQYVDVAQDFDQSPEGPKANLAPRSLTLLFKIMQLSLLCLCIYVSGIELKP